MLLALRRHPDFPSAAVTRIEVELARPAPSLLTLRYRAFGRLTEMLTPAPAEPERADELWKYTCFEAFIRPAGGEAYYEFNFSPSTQWAAYRFDACRAGMADAQSDTPLIVVSSRDAHYELQVMLELPPDARGAGRLGLSAVIEDTRGKSYWALAHAPGKPDFHHADAFAIELPAEHT
jgi:hypothetical protein